MLRLRVALVCTLGVLLLTPQAAAGGGWWSSIRLDRGLVAPGQRVELHASVWFRSGAAAEAAQQPDRFHAYLLRGFDDSALERAMRNPEPGVWWSVGNAEATEVGPVTVRLSAPYSGRATAAFTVPELPPATYHLMLCNTGCTQPLADVIPAEGFTVAADPATARSELERLQGRVSSLAAERRGSPRSVGWSGSGWLVAAALAAAVVLLVLRRRPSRRPRPTRVVGWHPDEHELQELLSSESNDR
jgi:hypothetical protein